MRGGHVADYVRMWKHACVEAFERRDEEAWDIFEDIVDPPSDAENPYTREDVDIQAIIKDAQRLGGAKVRPEQIDDVLDAAVAVWQER